MTAKTYSITNVGETIIASLTFTFTNPSQLTSHANFSRIKDGEPTDFTGSSYTITDLNIIPSENVVFSMNYTSNDCSSCDIYTPSVDVTGISNFGSNAKLITNSVEVQTVDFIAYPASGKAPVTVSFIDKSVNNPISWAWDFTNNGSVDSTLQNPTYTYTDPGTYSVKLTTTNADGSCSITKTDLIVVYPLVVDFVGTPLSGEAPLTVQFTDLTTGELYGQWFWVFNYPDGPPPTSLFIDSTQQNPTWTFYDPGVYNVFFQVYLGNYATFEAESIVKYDYITVTGPAAPEADFTAEPLSGKAPLTVNFTDLSTNNPNFWLWYISGNINVPNTNDQNPSWIYTEPGVYSIKLTVSNNSGSDTLVKTDYITVLPPDPMILVFDTSKTSGSPTAGIMLGGIVNVEVDWDDGTIETFTSTGLKSHTYATGGIYTVKVSGQLTQFGLLESNPYAANLTSVVSWGDVAIVNMYYTFNDCVNLTSVPNNLPSTVTNCEGMFANAISFNQNINSWNVSNVTNMSAMFIFADSFNQPLNSWNTSNVTDMRFMFSQATLFNQNINDWDVSNVTTMIRMFFYAESFNQPLNNWNVSNVTRMDLMFEGALVFNQPLSNWNVGNVTNINSMFSNAYAFNQSLNTWNVSNVTLMSAVFDQAAAFNQPLNNWNVSNVTIMTSMFRGASSFNQNISNWCVSLIPTEPTWFAEPTFSLSNRPVWGTCP